MPEQKRVDPSTLGDLYPTPKTYDEQRAERAAINALKESRKPKHAALRASLLLTFCCALLIAIIHAVPAVLGFNIMAGAFTAMLLMIGLVWYVKWLIRGIIETYEINGKNPRPLLFIYPIFLGVLVILGYLLTNWRFISELPLICLTLVLHFAAVFTLAKLVQNIES